MSFTISQSLLKLMSIESVMPSNHLILCLPLLLLPSIFPSISVFSNELAVHIRCQSIGASASISVLPMNILISFKIDWFNLLAVQGTLKCLLQHHSSKASILLWWMLDGWWRRDKLGVWDSQIHTTIQKTDKQEGFTGTSLVVQWLRL